MVRLVLFFVVILSGSIGKVVATELTVTISGLTGPELDNVANSLQLAQLLKKETLLEKVTLQTPTDIGEVSDAKIKRLHRSAKNEIQRALQPFGFYKPSVKSSLELIAGVWTADYAITPGDAVLIAALDITSTGPGKDLAALQQVAADTAMQIGARLQHQQYSDTKAKLLQTAIDNGHLDAVFVESSLQINPKTNSASVTLVLDTGGVYYFGPVTINQNILSSDFLSQYVPFSEGDLFNPDRLIQLQLKLSDSGYFDRVDMTADREQAQDYRIPVVVDATAARPRKYTIGFGYGTDTGPRFKAGSIFRRVNKLGHNIHTDLLVSKVKNTVTGQYEIPMGNAGNNNLRFLAQYEQSDVGDGDIRKSLLGVNYSDTWRGVQRRLYLEYHIEDFRFGEQPYREAELLIPGVNLSFTKADNVLLPTNGYSWFLDLHGGAEDVVSDTTFCAR